MKKSKSLQNRLQGCPVEAFLKIVGLALEFLYFTGLIAKNLYPFWAPEGADSSLPRC